MLIGVRRERLGHERGTAQEPTCPASIGCERLRVLFRPSFECLDPAHGGSISPGEKRSLRLAGKTTRILNGGERAVLKVTLKRGTYVFLCTVPGHATLGMTGKILVR